MALPSVTNTFTSSTTGIAADVNTNFTDVVNGLSDGNSRLNINDVAHTNTFISCVHAQIASTLSIGNDLEVLGNSVITGSLTGNDNNAFKITGFQSFEALTNNGSYGVDPTQTLGRFDDGGIVSYINTNTDGDILILFGKTGTIQEIYHKDSGFNPAPSKNIVLDPTNYYRFNDSANNIIFHKYNSIWYEIACVDYWSKA